MDFHVVYKEGVIGYEKSCKLICLQLFYVDARILFHFLEVCILNIVTMLVVVDQREGLLVVHRLVVVGHCTFLEMQPGTRCSVHQ